MWSAQTWSQLPSRMPPERAGLEQQMLPFFTFIKKKSQVLLTYTKSEKSWNPPISETVDSASRHEWDSVASANKRIPIGLVIHDEHVKK